MTRGKVQYYTATSLDGFIADENNALDWLDEAKRENDGFVEFFAGLGAFVMGRTTFDWVAAQTALYERPEQWNEWYEGLPCWVFTNRPLEPVPGAVIHTVAGPVAPVYPDIMEAARGKNVWLAGGGELVGAFADEGLLDELILQIAPVTLGQGAQLLPRRIPASRLELIEARQNGPFIDARYGVSPPAANSTAE